jgi:RNA polymerase sigma-70 factor (ECF subfamily)
MDDGPTQISRDILAAVKAGDDSSSRQLIDMLYPVVIPIIRNHRPRAEAEEDLCQDVFLKVFGRLDQYAWTQPFEHWVARIALNTCYDRLRRQRRQRVIGAADLSESESLLLEVSGDERPLPEGGAGLARELLEKLLGSLKPRERMVLHLLDLEEKSVAEVGALTGWGASRIRVTAMRARRKLSETLARLEGETRDPAP